MRMNKYSINGFTLIELMVVVGIIGILASMAIPNFRKYQAKAKSVEATLNLSALFTGEKAVFGQHNTYVACIAVLGVAQAPAAYYVTGFHKSNGFGYPALLGESCTGAGSGPNLTGGGPANLSIATGISPSDTYVAPLILKVTGNVTNVSSAVMSALSNSYLSPGGAVDVVSTSFTAITAGSITPSSSTLSVWSIDENKRLIALSIGY